MAPKTLLTAGLMLTFCLLAPMASQAQLTLPSGADEATTHAYLIALYTYEQAVVANQAAAKASLETAIGAIGSQCPGVLEGTPPTLESEFSGPGSASPSARAVGESSRRERQLSMLKEELIEILIHASSAPNRQAAETFAGAIASLSWSNPAIARLAQDAASQRVAMQQLASPDLCADLKGWVASGYRTLTTSTKQFLSAFKSHEDDSEVQLSKLLKPYEGPAEKQLSKQIAKLSLLGEALNVGAVFGPLPRTLGFPAGPGEETRRANQRPQVTLTRGKTATGESYKALVQPPEAGYGPPDSCVLQIQREQKVSFDGSEGNIVVGLLVDCSHSGKNPEASVNCEEGRLVIQTNTLPRTSRVVLHLSDGRKIASHPIKVPRRLGGGPGGLYYQVVRGPLPIPVSLSELDGHGRKLREVGLPHVIECTKHPVHFLPGGVRTLVRASVPQGPAFSLTAEHYRYLGHTYFGVHLAVKPLTTGSEEGDLGRLLSTEGKSTIMVGDVREANPFTAEIQTSCRPHSYAIVYGVLRSPGAKVLARLGGKLQELRYAPIPAGMHARGKLAYRVLPTLPEALITRSAQGKTLHTEKYGNAGRQLTETCEGEAEG